MLPRLKQTARRESRLDRLRWPAGLSFRAYGVRIGVRTTDADLLGGIKSRLPPGWTPAASPIVDCVYSVALGKRVPASQGRRPTRLFRDSVRLARSSDVDLILDTLESDLQTHIAENAPARIFVHAGVVGWRGRAIVLPGRSYAGKSTLVAALVRAGATYYSDEYAVLDARGRVHPFARPLSLRGDTSDRPTRLSPDALGSAPARGALPVGVVMLAEYAKGARWRPKTLTPGHGLLALLAHTLPAQRRPRATLRALEAVVRAAPVLEGARGEAPGMAKRLLAWLTPRP